MRGKEAAGTWEHWRTRITPAYAGKSFAYCSCNVSDWDHPRVCGEKLRISARLCIVMGSPPRMRGKAEGKAEIARTLRITPAYAGKRTVFVALACNMRDHPRVCGEKQSANRLPFPMSGSPPRMRGKVSAYPSHSEADGITPAYAGKRGNDLGTPLFSGDHPRVCGEKFPQRRGPARFLGSPPRMRGKD